MTSFLVTFDITAVVVAMPRIKEDLHLDVAGFAWVMDAYSLAFTAMLMAAGVLADRYGRRKALLFGNLVFALASLACGMAWSDVSLWSARVVQGLGAAFGLSLMSDHYREQQQRVEAFALAGTVTGAAMALGPSGGGLVADLAGWRWVFLVNIPVCLLIAIVLPRVTHESRDSTARRIDLAGVATLTLSLLSLIWLLLHGRVVGGVEVPPLIAFGAVLACFGAFIATQKLQTKPMIDLSLFADRSFLGICLVPFALSISYWSLLVYLPLFLQQGLGQPLDRTSLLMLAATLPMLLLPFAGARIAARLKSRGFFSLGLGVVSVGVAVVAGAAATGSLPLALVGMALSGAGTAVLNSQVSGAIVSMAPRERAGTVSAIATVLRQGGFAAGIAVLGALLSVQQASPSLSGASQPFVLLFVTAAACSLTAALLVLALVKPPQAAANA
jgi:MFS family permease